MLLLCCVVLLSSGLTNSNCDRNDLAHPAGDAGRAGPRDSPLQNFNYKNERVAKLRASSRASPTNDDD
jgi:hypothetical protein